MLSAPHLFVTALPKSQLLSIIVALLSSMLLLEGPVLSLDPHVDQSAVLVGIVVSVGDWLEEVRLTERV